MITDEKKTRNKNKKHFTLISYNVLVVNWKNIKKLV